MTAAPPRPPFLPSVGRWLLCLLTALPLLTAALVVAPISRGACARLMRVWGQLQLIVFGIRVVVEDRNRDYASPPYVVTHLNQVSLSETFVMLSSLPAQPARLFSNLEYLLIPLLGWAFWLSGSIMVRRGSPTQRRRALDRAKQLLQRGESFYISIEGRRSESGLLPYKKGPVLLAMSAGAPLVPLVMIGAAQRLPVGEWRVRPGPVRVVLCEAIPTRGLLPGDVPALVDRLRAVAERELAA